jgi:hypothetical protein
MKSKLFAGIVAMTLVSFVSISAVQAQSTEPAPPATEDTSTMKHECKEMHKDGKTCDHEMMGKCEEHMKSGECPHMNKKEKTKATKKK